MKLFTVATSAIAFVCTPRGAAAVGLRAEAATLGPFIGQLDCPNNLIATCGPAGAPCTPTCSNPEPTMCAMMCEEWTCGCPGGLVLDMAKHKCVKPHRCPNTEAISIPSAKDESCPKNRERVCLPDMACVATCASPNPGMCAQGCQGAGVCGCAHGKVLDEATGRCVKPARCSDESAPEQASSRDSCPKNRERVCLPDMACVATCASPNPDMMCAQGCEGDGVCGCAHGKVLDEATGRCVKPARCSDESASEQASSRDSCPKNRERVCLPDMACVATCASPNPGMCAQGCEGDGVCGCAHGKVLDETTGRCVNPSRCSSSTDLSN